MAEYQNTDGIEELRERLEGPAFKTQREHLEDAGRGTQKYRLLIPARQDQLEDENVISAAWLGNCVSHVMDRRELKNWLEQFFNDGNMTYRFYIEQIQ